MRRAGMNDFTLVELLIVIAILAILCALLLPALNNAREKGRSIACMSTEKQLGIVLLSYADSHDDYVLASQGMDGSWLCCLEKYGLLRGSGPLSSTKLYHVESRVMFCPSQEPLKSSSAQQYYRYPMVSYVDTYHFGLNLYVSTRPLDGYPQRKLSRIFEPSKTFWALETTYSVTLPSTSYESGAHRAYFRHSRFMNILFMDGHAESRNNLGYPSTTSRNWRGDLPRNQITYD